ncbi:hypothetical protein [Streptomyces sp. NPDC005859]|uniref:hypothetical protein n=1 Tax=Streptomyces sp. NPDC005859 TaxID=3157170 RepID=UPI003408466D
MTTTLAKGGNAVLSAAVCRITLTSPTTGTDVSAVLLAQDGKVRTTHFDASNTPNASTAASLGSPSPPASA